MFTPNFGGNSHFDEHIFQMGWFNHQGNSSVSITPVLSEPFHTPRNPTQPEKPPSVSSFYLVLQAYDLSKTWWLRYLGTLKRNKTCNIYARWPTSSYKGGDYIRGRFLSWSYKWATSYISGLCSPYLKTADTGAHLVAGGNGKEGLVAWHLKSQTITGNSLELLPDGFAVFAHPVVRCFTIAVKNLLWEINGNHIPGQTSFRFC